MAFLTGFGYKCLDWLVFVLEKATTAILVVFERRLDC